MCPLILPTDGAQIVGKRLQDAFVDSGDFIFPQGPDIGLVVAGKHQAFIAGWILSPKYCSIKCTDLKISPPCCEQISSIFL